MARKRLGEILIQAGVLDEARLRAGLNEQRRWGGHLGRILVDMKLISEEVMVQALSQQLNFPTVDLDHRAVAQEVLELVPADLAEQHGVVPFNVQTKFLDVAMGDPTNLGVIDELRIRTRLNVRPYLAGPKMLERALARFYGRGLVGVDSAYPSTMMAHAQMLEVDTNDGLRPTAAHVAHVFTPLAGAVEQPLAMPVASQGDDQAMPSMASAHRAQHMDFVQSTTQDQMRDREIAVLQERVQRLEALVARDEEVLRKLLALLIDKGVATREEILEKLR